MEATSVVPKRAPEKAPQGESPKKKREVVASASEAAIQDAAVVPTGILVAEQEATEAKKMEDLILQLEASNKETLRQKKEKEEAERQLAERDRQLAESNEVILRQAKEKEEADKVILQQKKEKEEADKVILRQQQEKEEADKVIQQQKQEKEKADKEAERQLAESNKVILRQAQEKEEADKENKQRFEGEYYATLNDLWRAKPQKCQIEHYTALKRPSCPSAYTEGANAIEDYIVTVNAANNPDDKSETASVSSSQSKNTGTTYDAFPRDIFGNESGEIAHLMPASTMLARFWAGLVLLVLGQDATLAWPVVERFINGVNRTITIKKTSKEAFKRRDGTGVKHSPANKIRLPEGCHKYFDRPCVHIIPIMTLDEAKSWKGGAYDAILLVGDETRTSKNKDQPLASASSIYKGMGLTTSPKDLEIDPSTPEGLKEIEMSRSLLENVTLGVSYCIRDEKGYKGHLCDTATKEIYKRMKVTWYGYEGGQVPVPKWHDEDHLLNLKPVRKIKFSPHGSLEGHPAPDPFLLTMKAAMNWTWRLNVLLLGAGECDDDDEEEDPLDRQAIEEYLEYYANKCKPQALSDLSKGFGRLIT